MNPVKLRSAFTLIELMLVVALMGVMGTLAVGSYSAVTRGMSERAALNASDSIAKAALERAQIDRTKTYLFLFDEVVRVDSDTTAGLVQGVAVAVRPTGRVTKVDGAYLYDEFGDLDQAFSSLDSTSQNATAADKQNAASTMRVYNLSSRETAEVEEGFYTADVTDQDIDEADANGNYATRTWTIAGFKQTSGASFKVGDAYGMEFAVSRLPPGFTFGSSANMSSTSDLGQKKIQVYTIDPDDTSAPSFAVYRRRPDGSFDQIGTSGNTKDTAQ